MNKIEKLRVLYAQYSSEINNNRAFALARLLEIDRALQYYKCKN